LFDDDKDFKNKNNMFMCVDLFNQADFFKIYSTKPLKSQTCKIDLLANSRRRSPADFSPTSSPLPLPCSSSGFNSKETCSDEVDPYGCKKKVIKSWPNLDITCGTARSFGLLNTQIINFRRS